jgi:hypothetical protein
MNNNEWNRRIIIEHHGINEYLPIPVSNVEITEYNRILSDGRITGYLNTNTVSILQ